MCVCREQSCNIISENDVDFGRVLVPAIDDSNVLPSVNVDRSSGIDHLGPEQRVGCPRCLMSLLRVSARNQICAELVECGCYLHFLCVRW